MCPRPSEDDAVMCASSSIRYQYRCCDNAHPATRIYQGHTPLHGGHILLANLDLLAAFLSSPCLARERLDTLSRWKQIQVCLCVSQNRHRLYLSLSAISTEHITCVWAGFCFRSDGIDCDNDRGREDEVHVSG